MDTHISGEPEALDMGSHHTDGEDKELGCGHKGVDANAWCFLL